jgi:hypothetical protein
MSESNRTISLSSLLSMASAAVGECDLVIVAGETFSIGAVVGGGDQSLLLGLKQLCTRRRQFRVAIPARKALRGVAAVVKGYWPLSPTAVIECSHVSAQRVPSKEAQE